VKVSILLTLAGMAATLSAQPRIYTAADYERAEKALTSNTTPLVFRSGVRPTWLADERFWYRVTTPDGSEFMLVDTAKGTRAPAFDHVKLAAALTNVAGARYDANHLPFTEIDPSPDGRSVAFNVGAKRFTCDVAGSACADAGAAIAGGGGGGGRGGRGGGRGGRGGFAAGGRAESMSPDGKRAVFIRDNNLWVRQVAGGGETQLTKDGVNDFGYATDNAGWQRVHPGRSRQRHARAGLQSCETGGGSYHCGRRQI
jgi:hypothetical protein